MAIVTSTGCPNYRDVGESLALVSDAEVFPTGRLLRGGKIDFVTDEAKVGNPATVLNLRRGKDPERLATKYFQVAASNDLEKYETHNREVRAWLNEVLSLFADPLTRYPVLVHCTSGKDRTGIVVASLLLVVGIPREWIVEEYLLSEGDVREEWIDTALDGISDTETYFNRVNLEAVRNALALEFRRP